MSAAAAGFAAAAVVLIGIGRWSPGPGRARPTGVAAPTRTTTPRSPPLTVLGGQVFRLLGVDPTPAAASRAGMGLAGAVAGVPLGPAGVLVGVAAAAGLALVAARIPARRAADAVVAELPDLVDLLAVAVAGGSTVRLALEHVTAKAASARPTPPVASALAGALERARAGDRLADALAGLPELLGDAVRPLVTALVTTERTGAPLLPSLERLAAEYRTRRRRRAEERARSLPVKLLFPLVVCILPAFGLLTVVPLIAGALRGLQL